MVLKMITGYKFSKTANNNEYDKDIAVMLINGYGNYHLSEYV